METDYIQTICSDLASNWEVLPDIHSEDFIFQFLWDHPSFPTKENAVEYYFNNGADSANKLSSLLTDICGYSNDNPCNLLEFASGYGCVTRHIEKTIPFCSVTASDIHPQAIQFIQEKLKINTILSAHSPQKLELDPVYDVVFALSFFSHMPKSTFSAWLKKLASFIKPNGYFIFTTHGLITREKNGMDFLFSRDGFYFEGGSEQKDIEEDEYGTTITLPEYVFSEIAKIPQLSPVYFREGYWWEHQDLFVLKVLPETLRSPSIPTLLSSKEFYASLPPRVKNRVKIHLSSSNKNED